MVFARLQVFPSSTCYKLCLYGTALLNFIIFQCGVFIVPAISFILSSFVHLRGVK